jgi:glycosyltransferase involved in cell wall biosynthesis
MYGLVSIIMPSYNTGRFIAESIRSVLAQTYTNWELIIVDDASTDNTDEVVAPYCHPREGGDLLSSKIHYLKNAQNSGAAVSRNRALREARGKWIAFLDSDDLWTPDKLEKQVAFMEKNGYAFSYTRYGIMGEDGVPTKIIVGGPERITKTGMFNYCWPGCLTVMYNREVVGDIQIADIKKNNDYAMWLKICKKADCYLLPEKLANYRVRNGSISRHSHFTLIKWHYKLYREAEVMNPLCSLCFTVRNLFFGVWKKFRYVKN